MRQHVTFGYEMLSGIEYLRPSLDVVYYHHEKWDGSGYPTGLHAEEIPLPARIFAVADVYEALTSNRPYRPAWPKSEAVSYIRQQIARHFDPDVVDTFLGVVG
jgi:HD-GYP domain-containing protein (c-di-GMP phosphodiesterase class II)